MNIVCINHCVGSSALAMESRLGRKTREWKRAGHSMRVVAARCSSVPPRQPVPGNVVIDAAANRWSRKPAGQGKCLDRAVRNWGAADHALDDRALDYCAHTMLAWCSKMLFGRA